MVRNIFLTLVFLLQLTIDARAEHRHWTVAEGLPTGEVQQIVELPNGQMLVNCEGVFCLSNGARFQVVPCEMGRCYPLSAYGNRYGHLWQGDSLLWLRDFYRIYLFDARQRAFRYDMVERMDEPSVQTFAVSDIDIALPTADQQRLIDSLGLGRNCSAVVQDRQGGLWIGTRTDGIVYVSPRSTAVHILSSDNPLCGLARSNCDGEGRVWHCKTNGLECEEQGCSTLYNINNVVGLPYNRTTFIEQVANDRYLLCDSFSTLGYFLPRQREFISLNKKIPSLKGYRHFVGACPVSDHEVVVYSQNGAFVLDTKTDTVVPFGPAKEIERYAMKYNCMQKDKDGNLWVGTQNGLFKVRFGSVPEDGQTESFSSCQLIDGLMNNCIRSLVLDREGHLWAGTSQGISRITPTVVNLGTEDAIPAKPMMERAACLTAEGQLVFVTSQGQGLMFRPEEIITYEPLLPVVLTGCRAGQRNIGTGAVTLTYDENYLTLQFSTLDYAAPSHTRYRYRLQPLEKDWNYSGDGSGAGSASYTALPPGNYVFEVQAATTTDEWGAATLQHICITPPWWLTWWAKLIYVIFAVLVVMVAMGQYLKHRKEKLERENEERVNQLFELRDEARYQFSQSVNIDPQKISSTQQEEQLVEKLLKSIAEHMDDGDYTVDQLAGDVAMSRSSLYKKMQTMLGITPNEFLRNVRLKHAAKLLAETDTPVNQVSLMVGFQTPRYFSQCFRQLFGVLPSEYRNGSNDTPST